MNDEALSSVAVVDNAFNVVGNISTADVKLLTNSTSLPLLKSSCIHFISVILSERGIGDGKDSFPGEFKHHPFLYQGLMFFQFSMSIHTLHLRIQ